MHSGRQRWHQMEGHEQAREVVAIVDALYAADAGRRQRYQRHLGLYEGRRLQSLGPDAYYSVDGSADDGRVHNLHRSGVDTMHAEIAGNQRPKPQMLTSGADWKTRRTARKLDRFLEATLSQPQGRYTDAWELWADAWLDCEIYGVGVVHISAVDERVCIEKTKPWEILVDPTEASHGTLRNIFRYIDMDVDKACDLFCSWSEDEEERKRIRAAIYAESSPEDAYRSSTGTRVVETIRIREAIALPMGDQPGAHVYAVSGGVLYAGEWDRPRFPFVFLRWAADRVGWWAQGLVGEGEALDREVNDLAQRLSERVRLCSTQRIYYRPGSLAAEHLEENGAEVHIAVMEGHEYPRPEQVPPYTAAEAQHEATQYGRYYSETGVSQQAASSRKEPGIDSGAAIRAMNSLHSARFRLKARAYEQSFVMGARLIIDAMRDLAEDNPGFAVEWKGRGFLQTIKWQDVDLSEDQYEVSVAAASMLTSDPAGRLQMAQELFSSQVIGKEAFTSLIGWPDLEDTLRGETAESDYVEHLIDRYLDAEDNAELDDIGGFVPPEGFIVDKPGALLHVARAYFQAARDGAPEYNLGLLRDYIQQLDALMKPPAPPPGAMPGPAMGAAPPMIPPGPVPAPPIAA